MSIPKEKWGVHKSHCCVFDGCKYGYEDCPVVTGETEQLYPCEDCGFDFASDDRCGIYKHFKGGMYQLFMFAKDSTTLEEVAIYRNPKGDVWTRPWLEFDDIHPESHVKRFTKL